MRKVDGYVPSLFHDYDMVSCGGKTNGAEVDERVWSQATVFSVFSAMLGDLTEDPSAWRDVKRKLNGMLGKVDMNPVLIDAFALAYSQVEIARLEALETERVDKLVEGACKDAFEALRQRRKEKESPEAVVEEEPVTVSGGRRRSHRRRSSRRSRRRRPASGPRRR